MQEPSIWQVAPIGITTKLTSRGTPIRSHASICPGIAAAELLVPSAVKAGVRMFLKYAFPPFVPPAKNVYSVKNTSIYKNNIG